MKNTSWPFLAGLIAFLGLFPAIAKEPKKKEDKAKPQLIVSMPLGIQADAMTKVIFLGLRVDTTTEVRVQEPGFTVKIVRKNKIGGNTMVNPSRIGDSEVEAEIKVPADFKAATANVVVVTPQGESPPYKIQINAKTMVAEKEPNNSFAQAQPIPIPALVEGRIQQNQDVDVYKVECSKGQKISVDVMAARLGSALDSILLFHNSEGQLIDSNDDADPSGDSHLEIVVPKSGVYFITILDASDHGGTAYAYRLSVHPK